MSNRRKDRPVPDGYVKYSGEYNKCWYDVYTFNGVEFKHCWPNAGMFHSESGQYVPGDQVFAVRLEIDSTKYEDMTAEEQEATDIWHDKE